MDNLYKRAAVDWTKCIYCGGPGSSRDHVPPRAKLDVYGSTFFFSRGIPLVMYPSCLRCNSLLIDKPLFVLEERIRYIMSCLTEEETIRLPRRSFKKIPVLPGNPKYERPAGDYCIWFPGIAAFTS